MSYSIVGFTHSDGYCLCTDCEDGTTVDEGNESGYVFPIFEDSEWDSYPSCDRCNCAIEDVQLTSYGLKQQWLQKHSGGMRILLDANNGEFPTFADGDYPLYYLDEDNCTLCAKCANKQDSSSVAVAYGTNWEDSDLYCDDCNSHIASAYGSDKE